MLLKTRRTLEALMTGIRLLLLPPLMKVSLLVALLANLKTQTSRRSLMALLRVLNTMLV
jgi:hypothetical protein